MSTAHADRVAEYYDANTAPFYLERWHEEDIHFGLFPRGADPLDHFTAVKVMTDAIVVPAAIASGERVVDAGCGVGGAAIDIARSSGAEVLGLTISGFQVEHARKRAAKAGLAKLVRFERADCSSALPCDDGSIDAVVTIETACHFQDKPRFLAECRRVLRPGGRLAGSDWMARARLKPGEYDQWLRPVDEAWRLAGMADLPAWKRMLDDAGLDVVEAEDLGKRVAANIAILAAARQELRLEVANGCHPEETARLWHAQYDSLVAAWKRGAFTIGRFLAVAR